MYAHVPDINDFTRGLKRLLKPRGTITLEFPHLMRLIEHSQFDTIYHEHFSYLSLCTTDRIFRSCGLRIRDVEELPTHGGSLRVFGCHAGDPRPTTRAVGALLDEEKRRGLQELPTYQAVQARANRIKDDLLRFLIEQKYAGKTVAAYGAAAKGNTLLNYAGIKPDLLPFVCDAAPSKQGKYHAGQPHPDIAACAIGYGYARLSADPAMEYRRGSTRAPCSTESPGRKVRHGRSGVEGLMKPRIHYTKPSITELEVRYATDAAANGWGDQCYDYIDRFEELFKQHLGVQLRHCHLKLHRRPPHGHGRTGHRAR